jgi:alkyl sulfatase BDS1-like metallo-beta-lactamase superfamily hydrolase
MNAGKFMSRLPQGIVSLVCLLLLTSTLSAQGIAQRNILEIPGMDSKEAIKVNDHIYQAVGFGNTYLVKTKDGNVIIDTSNGAFATKHQTMLRKISNAPTKYIIVTHAHPDHVGGIGRWREKGTEVIAHASYPKFRDYQRRLSGLFERRNAAQYALPSFIVKRAQEEFLKPEFDASITFEKEYKFKLGELTFEIYHSIGETQDQINVWIPELKAAFIGDNMYETFPNIYTLRGTEFRSPIEWMASLERVIGWEPEVLLGSHMLPIQGKEEIKKKLTHYRDAIRYVHDETVKGMNEGKDVHTLMSEIKLPKELAIGEQYGRLTWSIRGIYEGYVGWFDENPSTMYEVPVSAVDKDIVELAGGPDPLVKRAKDLSAKGESVKSLHLLDIVLRTHPSHADALQARINAYKGLLERSVNVIEQGWLRFGIRRDELALKKSMSNPSSAKN